jgi:hypothetical protein
MELYQDTHPKGTSTSSSPDGPHWPPVTEAPELPPLKTPTVSEGPGDTNMDKPHAIPTEASGSQSVVGLSGRAVFNSEEEKRC